MKLTLLSLLLFSTSLLACPDNLKPYNEECELSDRLQNVKSIIGTENINYVAEYRALRFIQKRHWDQLAPEKNYLPWLIYDPAPLTWQYWERGEKFRQTMTDNKEPLTIDLIESLHAESINRKLMGKVTQIFKFNSPGKIRTFFFQEAPYIHIKCMHRVTEKDKELIQNYDLKDYKGVPLLHGTLIKCPDGQYYQGLVKYLKSTHVKKELERLFETINTKLALYEQGIVQPLSPLEFSADMQRWFIAIHPFGDGNGRTSRFIQDYIHERLGLPFAPAGKLYYEEIVPTNEYRTKVKKVMFENIELLEQCSNEWQSPNKLSGSCHHIYKVMSESESDVWKEAKEIFFNALLTK